MSPGGSGIEELISPIVHVLSKVNTTFCQNGRDCSFSTGDPDEDGG